MKFEAGQFWKCRDGVRAKVIAVVESTMVDRAIVYWRCNDTTLRTANRNGNWADIGNSDYDLVEYLPWCNSFDDDEPKPTEPPPGYRLLAEDEPKQAGDVYRDKNRNDGWEQVGPGSWKNPFVIYARRIEPKYIPWTRETCPIGAVCIGANGDRGAITFASEHGCDIGGHDMRWGYKELLESLVRCDGLPCGTMVQP